MDPDTSVVFAYDGVPAHLDLAIPAPHTQLMLSPSISSKGFKLSESDTKGRHLESGNLKMYNRNEGKALAIPLAEFGNNNSNRSI